MHENLKLIFLRKKFDFLLRRGIIRVIRLYLIRVLYDNKEGLVAFPYSWGQ